MTTVFIVNDHALQRLGLRLLMAERRPRRAARPGDLGAGQALQAALAVWP